MRVNSGFKYVMKCLFLSFCRWSYSNCYKVKKYYGFVDNDNPFYFPLVCNTERLIILKTIITLSIMKLRRCLHATGSSSIAARLHPGSIPSIYIRLHDT